VTAERQGTVVTPNGTTLPGTVVDGVKVFHLGAGEVRHEFAPGLVGRCWGYNGQVHGPTIEAVEGDRVRIYVTNRLPAPTSIHWHGIHLPSGMDGVAGMTQRAIEPGETFRYEFTLTQHGTFDFAEGTERKLTGSYYTPPELVAELIKSALVPVIEDRLQVKEGQADQERALLSIKVVDPACGAGAFLIQALDKLSRFEARSGASARLRG
jgi:hypothetical protein